MQISLYDNLKFSGSIWLGDIPTHWGTKKLKFLATVQPSNVDKKTVEGEEPVILCNYTDVYKNDYIDRRLEFMQASATKAEIEKFKVEIGDVIVTKDSETPDDIAVPACVAEEVEGLICGYHLTQIKPINLHARYLFRLFQSKGFNAQFVVSANGVTRFGLPQHAIANAFTPLPPLDEQQAIARFLDFKTAQIDALIAKKKSLLDKLAEKRTALISHTVTKGLDPLVEMKDSGVAWIGKVPKHWDLKRIKDVATYNDESLDEATDPDFEIEYVDISSVSLINGVEQSEPMTFEKSPSRARRKVKHGDIIVSTVRTYLKAIASISSPPDNMIVSTGFAVIRPKENFNSSFAGYLLQTTGFVGEVVAYSVGVSYPAINASDLVRIAAVEPPLDEQLAIVQFLDEHVAQLNSQRQRIEEVILKLQEYRLALITNAVTGKIDVRGFEITKAVTASADSDE
jgi:type I restriction enzyme S subunit